MIYILYAISYSIRYILNINDFIIKANLCLIFSTIYYIQHMLFDILYIILYEIAHIKSDILYKVKIVLIGYNRLMYILFNILHIYSIY